LVGRPRGYFDMYARLLGAALVARRRKGQKMNPAMLIGSRPTLSEILKKGNL